MCEEVSFQSSVVSFQWLVVSEQWSLVGERNMRDRIEVRAGTRGRITIPAELRRKWASSQDVHLDRRRYEAADDP